MAIGTTLNVIGGIVSQRKGREKFPVASSLPVKLNAVRPIYGLHEAEVLASVEKNLRSKDRFQGTHFR
jgi:hypothetical protein